jgi:hypothetical protein
MEGIIIDLDKIKDIKNSLESVIRTSQKVDSVDFNKIIKQYQTDLPKYLDEYEGKIFEYIRKNPGVSKEDVVKAGIRSRNPVYTILENLEKYNLIIVRPDKTKAKRLQLFENKKSLIIQIENGIKNFKKSYLALIKRANTEYQKRQNLGVHDSGHELRVGSKLTKVAPEIYSAFVDIDLMRILQQLIQGYAVKAIFEWPEEIKDPESLNRLYLMVFHMLSEIFSEHVKYSIPLGIQDEQERAVLFRESLQDSFDDPTIYRHLIQDFDNHNWNTEFDSVMSNLFTALNMRLKWKDYRAMSIMRPKKHS